MFPELWQFVCLRLWDSELLWPPKILNILVGATAWLVVYLSNTLCIPVKHFEGLCQTQINDPILGSGALQPPLGSRRSQGYSCKRRGAPWYAIALYGRTPLFAIINKLVVFGSHGNVCCCFYTPKQILILGLPGKQASYLICMTHVFFSTLYKHAKMPRILESCVFLSVLFYIRTQICSPSYPETQNHGCPGLANFLKVNNRYT